jgi:hypothetical protein
VGSTPIWTKNFWQPHSRYQSVCCACKYALISHKLKPTVTVTKIDFHLVVIFVAYYVSYSRELFCWCLGVWECSIWPVAQSAQFCSSWYTRPAAHGGWHGHLSASSELDIFILHNFCAVICLYVQPVCRLLTDTCSLSL